MHAFIKQLEKPSFLNKLFFTLLTLVLVVSLLLTCVLFASYNASVKNLTHRFFINLLRQSNYSITYTNELSRRLATSLAYDSSVISFLNLNKTDNVQIAKTHQTVRKICLPLSYVDSVYLYNQQLDLILDSKSGRQSSLGDFYDQAVALRLYALQDGAEQSTIPFVHEVDYSHGSDKLYSYVIPYDDRDGAFSSAIVVNLRVDVLTQSLEEINANNIYAKFAVVSPDGTLLLDASFQSEEERQDLLDMTAQLLQYDSPEDDFTYRIGSTKYVVAYSNANSNGWYLCGMIPYSVLFRDAIATTLWSLLFILGLLAVCSYVILRLARRLSRPVEVINQLAQGHAPSEEASSVIQTQEFRAIADAFVQMRKKDSENSTYRDKTSHIVRKEFLEGLFCGTVVYSPEESRAYLRTFGCEWLLTQPCAMCLFSIDNYMTFSHDTNPREREALRFAIINLATEVLSEHFSCEMVQHGSSKFVAVLGCPNGISPTEMRTILESSLDQILRVVKNHLDFTLTAAHSSSFCGIEHLPRMYENLEELLLLRVHHGYGSILTPHMAEDLTLDDFRVSSAAENILVSNVVNGSETAAQEQFNVIADNLFQYSYNEIMPYLTHLAYRLLNSAKEANSEASQQIAEAFKSVSARLPQCEIESELRSCFSDYLQKICTILNMQRSEQESQSSNALISRVLQMIDAGYTSQDLCLSSIADELGLSTHYIGQLFRISQGKSVSQYILDLRLEKIAKEMRDTNCAFAEIMEEVGFEAKQKNYIYTCFKKHFGVTVKSYRAQFTDAV